MNAYRCLGFFIIAVGTMLNEFLLEEFSSYDLCPLLYIEGRKKTMHIYLYVTIHYTQKHLLLKCLDKWCWGSWSSRMPCLSHREVTHLLLFFILQMSHICCSDVFTVFLFIVLVLLPYVDIAVMEAKAFSCLKNLS